MMEFNKRNFWVISVGIASVGYLFSIATGSIGLMLIVLGLAVNYRQIQHRKLKLVSPITAMAFFYLLIVIFSFYSTDPNQANKEVVRFISFLIFPLLFYFSIPLNIKERKLVIRIFIWCLVVFFFACLVVAWKRQIVRWNDGSDFNWYFFYRYDFLELFDQHPTYVSIFTLLGLSLLHFLPHREKVFSAKSTTIILTAILSLALVLYGSRMGYVIYGVLGLVYIIRLVWARKFMAVARLLVLFAVMLVICWNIPIVKERILYTSGKKYEYKYNDETEIINGTPEKQGRLLLWQDAIEVILERPFLGYGTGASKKMLFEKYEEKGHVLFLEERYNAHNSYFELLLWGGIPLLTSYILILTSLFWLAYRKRDLVMFALVLIITITGITETLFLAQGILFIAFFICFLTQRHFYKLSFDKI